MRHLKEGKKFGRKKGQRKAFLQGLAVNLIKHGKMTTTETRAKETRRFVERLITHGKKQNIGAMRLLLSKLPKQTVYKIYHEIAPRYKDRKGGYTRIIKHTERRVGDGSKKATIEFV
ncbi:50S ribosomal protein L17 [Candidatus Jorgensenbacteria bacterium RIFCSPLOWO2_01_FULL_45_25b]|uniref:50S ribosomal protein L17 n=1 Tax=Candidatus Jorgensenbacteria bacterium RIFCSPLOWO2_01_FULL_45_25b TaxID=1798471 RepID=A0A1F6BT14_9BACT|nr:MAG: 50S ribosomal protein L17 [Candidatus Jorgensenbacteria bacterium RIFCSPLOWO2_01_FULL_45_25b]